MKKIFFLFMILLPGVLLAQVRDDFHRGMVLPKKIDLQELSVPSEGITKVSLKMGKMSKRYCIAINGNFRTPLHPVEVDSIMSVLWGKYDLVYKKEFLVRILKDMNLDISDGKVNFPDIHHTRWNVDILYSPGKFDERTRSFSYKDVTHPLYGLMKDQNLMTFDHLDLTDLVISSRHIKSLTLIDKPYDYYDMKHKYVPKLFFMIRFDDMEDTDSYVVTLSPEESLACGRYLLGEYTIFDKQVMLEFFLNGLKVENAREKKDGWRFYTTKKEKQRTTFNLLDFINLFVPGAFNNEEIARFEAMPVEQRKFITDISTGVALNNAPTMMDSFNSAQQAVIADHDNAR